MVQAVLIDGECIERLLGERPLPVEHVMAPSILVDGRFHTAGCHWLRRKSMVRPVHSTLVAHARRLANYIGFLRNDRGLDHPDERFADLFAATEDDVFAFYRARQFHAETAVSSAAWRAQLSTIKQAHEFLRATYDVPIPFRVVTFINPAGYASTTAPELRARTRTGSRGNPITPGYAELLVQGALRIDQHGHQSNARTVDRDAAAVSLALGSGLRHGTLTNITTYEIPPVVATPFTTMRIPDFITKGDAGGEAWIFSHRLKLVHAYINGARAELIADGRPYRPESPIQLDDADEDRWTATVDGTRRSVRWAETTDEVRRRLVNPDGSTPILLLNSYTPDPLSYDQVGTITATARDWTRLHLAPDFPARFRTHDLRHTYATHLTVCLFKGAVADYVHPDFVQAYAPTAITDAVEMAKQSLGHASEASTRLYTMHASKFLHVPLEHFIGEP